MKEEVLKELVAPITVKIKPGRGGYKYVDNKDVIERVNAVFKGAWRTEVITQEIIEDNVLVRVKVSCYDEDLGVWCYHDGYGSSQIQRFTSGPNKGLPVDIGNIFKGALAKAIAYACTRLGVGLILEDEVPSENEITDSFSTIPIPMDTVPTSKTVIKPIEQQPAIPALPSFTTLKTNMPTVPVTPITPQPVEEKEIIPESFKDIADSMLASTSVPPMVTASVSMVEEVPIPAQPIQQEQPVQSVPQVQSVPPVQLVQPAQNDIRPSDVPLDPNSRIKKKKESAATVPTMVPPSIPSTQASDIPDGQVDYISDVQKAALDGVLGMKKFKYEDLVVEALASIGKTLNVIPPPDKLLYKDAVTIVKYGNDANRKMMGK
jgi:hypothetical protein